MVIVDPVPVAELNPTIDALLLEVCVPSSSLSSDPSKYHLNEIDPPSRAKLVSGNDAVAIPVNVATPMTFDTLWGQ